MDIFDIRIWIGLIVLHIILVTIECARHVSIYDQMINGFYEADSSFCKESGLDMFSLFLDSDSNYGSRAGYILMVKDGDFIMNDPVTINLCMYYSSWNNWCLDPTKEKTFTIEINDINENLVDLEDVFPMKQTLKFYPMLGKIVMYNEDIVTAVLYKSGINTEIKDQDF